MKSRLTGIVVIICGVAVTGHAVQLGQQSVTPGLVAPSSGVVVQKGYQGGMTEGQPNLDVGLDWNAIRWKVGDSFHDQTWSPKVSLGYGVSDIFDIRATGEYLSLGDSENKLNAWRLGVGTRAWFPGCGDFRPYAGLLLNYYILDGAVGGVDFANTKGAFGLSAEAGVAYIINEWVAVRAGMQAETTVIHGKTDIGSDTKDVTLQGISFGLGLNVNF